MFDPKKKSYWTDHSTPGTPGRQGPDPFGKNTHTLRISNPVTHLCHFQNAVHLENPEPNTDKLRAIERGKQLCAD